MNIIESIGNWGMKTTPFDTERMSTPHAGDVVEFSEELRKYPVSCRFCRIDRIDDETGQAHLVNGMGSAFMHQDGSLEISGGPFFSVPLETLAHTSAVHQVTVWNWGDNSPGAGQGVDYHIDRPVFEAKRTPGDFQMAYSKVSETHARQGGEYNHNWIDETAVLIRSWPSHDGLTAYLFDLNPEA